MRVDATGSASFTTSYVWKNEIVSPVPKIFSPKNCNDYRPISVTPVLTRTMERMVVRTFMYPVLLNPPPALMFSVQYAFRPTGSTTAALVFLLQTITDLLAEQPYVVVIAFDFSKASDTVRHSTLLQKLASLDIPGTVYNWLVDYFLGNSHCTEFRGHISTFLNISASIVQGSAIGPVSYVVNAGDLTQLTFENVFCKYADDTYLVIPASNADSRTREIENVRSWSCANNLNLNLKKSSEIVFMDSLRRR